MKKILFWKLIILILFLVVAGSFWYFARNQSAELAGISEKNYPFTNPELTQRYDDPDLGFFVDYLEGFTVTPIVKEHVKMILFSKSDSKESFQIFIMPYDEVGPILPERILIDQPDIVIKDPQTVEIAGEEALAFFSTDPDIGNVREVWFVHGGHLYQASTYAIYDELLAKVMRTFRFK